MSNEAYLRTDSIFTCGFTTRGMCNEIWSVGRAIIMPISYVKNRTRSISTRANDFKPLNVTFNTDSGTIVSYIITIIIITIIIRFRQCQDNYRSGIAYRDNYPLYAHLTICDASWSVNRGQHRSTLRDTQ